MITNFRAYICISELPSNLKIVCLKTEINPLPTLLHRHTPAAICYFILSEIFLSSLATGPQLDASPLPPGGRSNLHYTIHWPGYCTANVTVVVKYLKMLQILKSIRIISTLRVTSTTPTTGLAMALQM